MKPDDLNSCLCKKEKNLLKLVGTVAQDNVIGTAPQTAEEYISQLLADAYLAGGEITNRQAHRKLVAAKSKKIIDQTAIVDLSKL